LRSGEIGWVVGRLGSVRASGLGLVPAML